MAKVQFTLVVVGSLMAAACRRLASLTVASTTALSPQKADHSQPATSPSIRGSSPPLTIAARLRHHLGFTRFGPDVFR
jgi:hypothetical protein